MANVIAELLKNRSTLILDGAMGTELEKYAVDTSTALWGALALADNPTAVEAVHTSYYAAGADIAITNSYQANPAAFAKVGLDATQSATLIKESVARAQAARQQDGDADLLVAGSVGPYGAYLADGSEYTGAYQLTQTEYRAFHHARMAALAAAGVDLFAFETMPRLDEVQALLAELTLYPDMTAWVSFSISDATHLADGTLLAEAVATVSAAAQVAAIGINCTPMATIEAAIRTVAAATTKPVLAYANNGDIYDATSKTWQVNPDAKSFAALAPRWVAAGARIIGGCCRSTPADIAAMAEALSE